MTLPLRAFVASPQQQAIFDFASAGTGSAIIIAVAGSGKSTTMVRMLPLFPENASIHMFAFNTPIAAELKLKIEALGAETGRAFRGVRASTFHSIGYAAIIKKLGLPRGSVCPDGKKVGQLARNLLGDVDYEMYASFACKLVGLAKGQGFGAIVAADEGDWLDLIRHHDMFLDDENASEERAVEIARSLLRASNEAAKRGSIDFDDQLYLPLLWRCRLWQNDVVIIDEAQDTNPVRRAIAKLALKPGGRLFAVGDPKQCQPAGTMIYVTGRGEVPIEKLIVGDKVLTYHNGFFRGTSTQGRRVEEISSRPYAGRLIKLSAGQFTHEVTPNHKCLVRMASRKGSVVYVMRKNGHARVGRCNTAYNGTSFGLGSRVKGEDAQVTWILGFFDDNNDDAARLLELTVAYKYRLPQMCFNYNELGGSRGVDVRKKFWETFPNNLDGMRECLKDFGLEEDYPFYTRNSGKHIGSMYSFELHACNVVSGWMDVCLFTGDQHCPEWKPVKITSRPFKGRVYSLGVEPTEGGRRLYVANGIVTHNSIYGFCGASHDAIDLIKTEFKCYELPLTVSYRCPAAVGAKARELVDYFQTAPGAAQGLMEERTLKDAMPDLGPQDAILCRNTAPLIDLAFALIGRGVGCAIMGRDIASSLTGLIKRMKARGVENLCDKLAAYRDREVAKYTAKGEEAKAEAVADRVACVQAVVGHLTENERTVPALVAKIESMFADGGAVLQLATAHKVKGKEFRNVAILRPDLMPSKWARQEWQYQQELNLQYVAWTRPTNALFFLTTETL